MANSAYPDRLASSEFNWIYTVCKGRVYPGSAGQGLIILLYIQKVAFCLVLYKEGEILQTLL